MVYEKDLAQSALKSNFCSVSIILNSGSNFLCHPCAVKELQSELKSAIASTAHTHCTIDLSTLLNASEEGPRQIFQIYADRTCQSSLDPIRTTKLAVIPL